MLGTDGAERLAFWVARLVTGIPKAVFMGNRPPELDVMVLKPK